MNINPMLTTGNVDILSQMTGMTGTNGISSSANEEDNDLFASLLNNAMKSINTTNSYLSEAENEEIRFALGETQSTHDLSIALQKASTALQYTIAVRDKMISAYQEIMQIQI